MLSYHLVNTINGDIMNKKVKKDKKHISNGTVDLGYNLEIERKDKEDSSKNTYDFVPRDYHWTSIEEQKIKVAELEEKTKS